MSLKHSYTIFAPVYDLFVSGVFDPLRVKSLQEMENLTLPDSKVLISGVGTGLDLPFLPSGREFVGIDITPAMLKKAQTRVKAVNITLQSGDVMRLPFDDNHFDAVVMHLILAVVPEPVLALQEAQGVLKTGGHILILDKFLRTGEKAPFRRLINPVVKRFATQTNVVFEEVLSQCDELTLIKDKPAMANGWFRRMVLQKITAK